MMILVTRRDKQCPENQFGKLLLTGTCENIVEKLRRISFSSSYDSSVDSLACLVNSDDLFEKAAAGESLRETGFCKSEATFLLFIPSLSGKSLSLFDERRVYKK